MWGIEVLAALTMRYGPPTGEVPLLSTERARRWFVNRTRVRRVAAEIHISKMKAFDFADVSASRLAFEERGCRWAWQAEC
jgi:hypothetical protein|tara:strand:- start:253 stop:492 length:240 start_codon:yes stop_codon:yes gene_type:complete